MRCTWCVEQHVLLDQLATTDTKSNEITSCPALLALLDLRDFKNKYPNSQTFTGPGGLFHKDEVPGYKTFDLEKAKALVQELWAVMGDRKFVYKDKKKPADGSLSTAETA